MKKLFYLLPVLLLGFAGNQLFAMEAPEGKGAPDMKFGTYSSFIMSPQGNYMAFGYTGDKKDELYHIKDGKITQIQGLPFQRITKFSQKENYIVGTTYGDHRKTALYKIEGTSLNEILDLGTNINEVFISPHEAYVFIERGIHHPQMFGSSFHTGEVYWLNNIFEKREIAEVLSRLHEMTYKKSRE